MRWRFCRVSSHGLWRRNSYSIPWSTCVQLDIISFMAPKTHRLLYKGFDSRLILLARPGTLYKQRGTCFPTFVKFREIWTLAKYIGNCTIITLLYYSAFILQCHTVHAFMLCDTLFRILFRGRKYISGLIQCTISGSDKNWAQGRILCLHT